MTTKKLNYGMVIVDEQEVGQIVSICICRESVTIGWKWQPDDEALDLLGDLIRGKPVFHCQVGKYADDPDA